MSTKATIIKKIIVIILINILCLSIFAISPSKAEMIEPQDNQYIEFRAVNFETIEGKDRQLIVEVWSNDLDIKGFDIRYQYDESVISHSNITTNEYTDDETEFFEYSNTNSGFLDLFTIPGESFTRMIVSLLPEEDRTETSEKIKDRGEGIGEVLDTSGGFLIGKLSFRTTLETIPSDLITLLPKEDTSPKTGIKVNFNGADSYEAQSLFRFTDATASKDADLSNLIVSSGIVDEVDPENSTYKEYNLTPSFEKETLSYQMELLEYVDELDIKAIQSDEKSTMKIKVPKRDDDGNLVYDTNGTTIIYEEKELKDGIPIGVTLNKLGEPDTNIKVIVTAEDGKNVKEYNLVIKRPYGTIKGSIYTAPTASIGIYKADIRIYKSSDVKTIIDWNTVSSRRRLIA